jgi:hypothetical protein
MVAAVFMRRSRLQRVAPGAVATLAIIVDGRGVGGEEPYSVVVRAVAVIQPDFWR